MSHSAYIPESCPDDSEAPWNLPDDNRKSFDCAACKKIGYEEEPGEYVDEFDCALGEAQTAADGVWVCSARCLSQAMFLSAGRSTQDALRRAAQGLYLLSEYLPLVHTHLVEWEGGGWVAGLLDAVDEAQESLAIQKEPEWAQNEPNEDRLERAIRMAARDLDIPIIHLVSQIKAEHEVNVPYASDYRTGRDASTLASIGNIALHLNEAIGGEA